VRTESAPETLDRIHEAMARTARALQAEICAALERLDGSARFSEDGWERPGGGGGVTRVLEGGAVLEKAGVNFSSVHGAVPADLARRLGGEGELFAATGLSVVCHPRNPFAPTAHLNVRFLRRGRTGWFGGGADLTPYYLFDEDCRDFHRALRDACERHGQRYATHKRAADDYFYLRHRREHRGVGGIFFDDLGGELDGSLRFAEDVARAFLGVYVPVLERRKDLPHGAEERRWQEIRRGRYVEFNLVYDRGTIFGLETSGRIESILMSLPPAVRWPYDHRAAPGSREEALLEVLRAPRDWA
jgi:coproporphyrinogen III oxidase